MMIAKLSGNFGVAVSGLITFVMVVLAVIVVNNLTGFNVFSFSFWVVIPAGAVLTGVAAASGYYFGSLFFHTRPTWFLLVQILIVTAAAQLVIYYGEYRSLVLDDGTMASDAIGFWDYLDTYLRSMHLKAGHGGHIDSGEVGDFGYWLAVIDFIGFILGGFFVFFMLQTYPTCWKCSRYLRKITKTGQMFPDHGQFAKYYDTLFQHPVDSRPFADLMKGNPKVRKPALGTVLVGSDLLGCEHCKTQLLAQKVQILGKKGWKDIAKLTRNVRLPDGVDLRQVVTPG
ncbi:hypothetical protein EOA27_24805 [Mesorhizobium sp. M2A.F.Ca.ET.037.01.1.1]|uniref:hypothetical protein n=2 Tax=Mesorhizobium TaxID=68287 RepID=UPI000FC9D03F|nr:MULTISPECIES: hypothetical protein [unclassified Mesorhizobium]RUY01318.1 hypothetical protein EOA25_23120 [Mesorhizobium sp. M2A.F.Ca.ET.040.01.1.1]RVC62943.1 hypothetical protein EN759_26800 [Mesorhizobium sp. M00.F.Ca.ET.038.03.1.1]RUX09236.1 hypothetical protein EOA27_24805 [Mesorhizobium sp. M2A.F.Ca.ET.037.01.1.1]RWA87812.1 MAG: hypothetical protein EOQ31_22590 [Mesorhizobium sp.]RWB43487.1 MAG: hypothetical protein EOQ44_17595 [Mesorhizobium sp.]